MSNDNGGVSAMSAELGLLARLNSLKVLLGTDSPEVRGWSPVVQQAAQATVNATISALNDINAMSYRLEQNTIKLADENERLRAVLERIGAMDPATDSIEGHNEWGAVDCFHQAQSAALMALTPNT